MSKHVRVRCPICGMLTWQSRLDEEWEFEVVIQHIGSKGRGRGFSNRYYHPDHEEGIFLLKAALADKLEAVARKLRGEVYSEKSDLFWKKIRAGESSEYWDLVNSSDVVRRAVVDTVDGESAVLMVKSEEQAAKSVSEPSSIVQRVSPSLWRSIRVQKASLMSSEADRYGEEDGDIADSEPVSRFERPVQPALFRTGGVIESQEVDESFESGGNLKEGGGKDGVVQSDNEIL